MVTGGVVSSIGKGITAASIGRILRSYGVDVTAIKIDPYLNWDSGTLNPYQHGEVFVTEDGMETDLDLGHYERFLDVNLSGECNITTGKVYSSVINKERRGNYLGAAFFGLLTISEGTPISSAISRRMHLRRLSSPSSILYFMGMLRAISTSSRSR